MTRTRWDFHSFAIGIGIVIIFVLAGRFFFLTLILQFGNFVFAISSDLLEFGFYLDRGF